MATEPENPPRLAQPKSGEHKKREGRAASEDGIEGDSPGSKCTEPRADPGGEGRIQLYRGSEEWECRGAPRHSLLDPRGGDQHGVVMKIEAPSDVIARCRNEHQPGRQGAKR